MTRIVWTESLREDLSPHAGGGAAPLDAKKAWTRMCDAFGPSREACEKGIDQAGSARDTMRAALALLASSTWPKEAPPAALGAVLSLMNALGRGDGFVSLVAQTHGVGAATRAVVDAHHLRNEFKHPKQWLVREASKAPFAWRALRAASLSGGEAEGLVVAREAWASAPLPLKVVLSHAFSSAPDLAADTAREVAALPPDQRLIVAPVLASLRDASLLDELLAHRMGAHPLVDAAMNLGEAALPAILAQWERPIFDRAHLARVTSCFEDERVARIFAGELTKKTTQQIARDWLLRFPNLAAHALAEIARARSGLGTLASELLEQTRRKSQTHDEVTLAELPMVLADPPWMRSKPKRSLRVVSVPAPNRREHAVLPPRVRAELIAQTAFRQFPEMTPEALAQYVARVREGAAGPTWWHERFLVPKSTVLELLREVGHNEHTGMYFPFQTVAVFGDEVVPAFSAWVEKTWKHVARVIGRSPMDDVLLAVDSHRLAAALLHMLGEPTASRVAWRYFSEHLEATLAGIIPLAVGERGAKRTAAEAVLRRLAKRWGDAVRSAAAARGDDVAASVAEILAYDERWACPKSPPKMPPSWKPEGFTRPRLRDGRALPLEAVERIGHMLAFSSPDDPYVGLEDVKAICDPRSLAELAWDSARAWETTSGRTADAWMMDALAWLGDDEVIRRTTPAIKHPHVIGVLGYAATDAAATELCTIRWRMTREGGRQRVHVASVDAALDDLARRRGKSTGEIEDALAPTIALPELRVRLDYGSRAIDVGFDERLDPFVEGSRGKLRELPKAGKKDDPEKVARAQQIWDELQEDVAAIADARLRSLERAMIIGRTWTLEAFRHAWTDNALMRHLARGVVWRASKCFRVAEDGSFADANDAAFDAGAEAISVAHPATMTEEERDAWRRVFFDYRITQPIDQLGRRILAAARGGSIALAPAAPLPLPEFHELLRDAGYQSSWRNREQVAFRACARSRHRTCVTLVTEGKNVVRAPLSAELDGAPADLSEVDPIDVSEVLQDLSLAVS